MKFRNLFWTFVLICLVVSVYAQTLPIETIEVPIEWYNYDSLIYYERTELLIAERFYEAHDFFNTEDNMMKDVKATHYYFGLSKGEGMHDYLENNKDGLKVYFSELDELAMAYDAEGSIATNVELANFYFSSLIGKDGTVDLKDAKDDCKYDNGILINKDGYIDLNKFKGKDVKIIGLPDGGFDLIFGEDLSNVDVGYNLEDLEYTDDGKLSNQGTDIYPNDPDRFSIDDEIQALEDGGFRVNGIEFQSVGDLDADISGDRFTLLGKEVELGDDIASGTVSNYFGVGMIGEMDGDLEIGGRTVRMGEGSAIAIKPDGDIIINEAEIMQDDGSFVFTEAPFIIHENNDFDAELIDTGVVDDVEISNVGVSQQGEEITVTLIDDNSEAFDEQGIQRHYTITNRNLPKGPFVTVEGEGAAITIRTNKELAEQTVEDLSEYGGHVLDYVKQKIDLDSLESDLKQKISLNKFKPLLKVYGEGLAMREKTRYHSENGNFELDIDFLDPDAELTYSQTSDDRTFSTIFRPNGFTVRGDIDHKRIRTHQTYTTDFYVEYTMDWSDFDEDLGVGVERTWYWW